MEWLYGRQVVRLALLPGAARAPSRVVGTPSALRSLSLDRPPSGLTVEKAETDRLTGLVGTPDHQGVVAQVAAYPYADADRLLDRRLLVVLDEVSDPRNLGAIVRTALAASADGLVIGRRRAAAVTPAAVKASAGATEHVAVARVTNTRSFLQSAQQRGFWVYGADAGAASSYDAVDYADRVVLVLGSEGRGLRRLTRETCDELVEIPVAAPVESLNVSVAAAVVLYEIARRRRQAT